MAALAYLHSLGFAAKLNGKRVRISPASKLNDEVRTYIKNHRLELLAELASNDGIERRCHWRVVRDGKPLCTMIGEPVTRAEAMADVRGRWPDADLA
ncbi:hypothetical protein [Pseudomonas fluorescens]|uniref:TubC N-terminal docking domain-containing protein n=1 Tax=Pseudomonas fluorescens TaxID=294 RepID=A0A5E7PU69_PSEFL|nr:hypothetical protein [Pseudomonas fluorescens]VVP53041.1 hypothetical protein PS880_05479 [Pseudomonas fluorescens]